MAYPLPSLAIIAPIIFIVLVIAFPVIGFFGGWKRAAFWGGGNFLFYVIGLLIWTFAHDAMSNLLVPFVQGLVPQLKDVDLSKIAASVLAPVFFILFMAIANLILLINYYAWYKRVVHIRKVDLAKAPKPTMKYRMINGAIGAVGLGVLTLPTTFAFTQALYFTTTSSSTRKNNAFSRNLYNGLKTLDEKVSWFSYYGTTKSYQDYDALFCGLAMTSMKITNLEGEDVNVIDAVKESVGGFGNVIQSLQNPQEGETVESAVGNSVNDFAEKWNNIIDQAGEEVSAIFQSENATEMIGQILGLDEQDPEQKITIPSDEATFNNLFGEGGQFDQMVQKYNTGTFKDKDGKDEEFIQIETIPMSKTAFDNLEDTLLGFCNTDSLTSDQKEQLDAKIQDLAQLLFEIK